MDADGGDEGLMDGWIFGDTGYKMRDARCEMRDARFGSIRTCAGADLQHYANSESYESASAGDSSKIKKRLGQFTRLDLGHIGGCLVDICGLFLHRAGLAKLGS